jgi:glycosyltransferase involved in cell wall biosynthesis
VADVPFPGPSRAGVLYLSYEGMLEPLGQSQVLAYLERLARDRPIHLVSYEKPADWADAAARAAVGERIRAAGIRWHPRRYHKRPTLLATGWDVFAGAVLGTWLVLRHRLAIVHARSYVPSAIALAVKRLTGARFVFDMRGFWADERVDGGLWSPDGRLYRAAKAAERRFLRAADHVVSLTHAAAAELPALAGPGTGPPPATVIPTCVDLDRFAAVDPAAPPAFALGYVGSAGTWYLFDAVVAAFVQLRRHRPGARMLVVNRHDHALVRAALAAAGVPHGAVELRAARHAEVPALMASVAAGVFFYRPSYSRLACAPTKLGEFLACGKPCLVNTGVGDMTRLVAGERVGVALASTDAEALDRGVRDLLALLGEPGLARRCRAAAERHFALEDGVARYAAIYDALAPPAPAAAAAAPR